MRSSVRVFAAAFASLFLLAIVTGALPQKNGERANKNSEKADMAGQSFNFFLNRTGIHNGNLT